MTLNHSTSNYDAQQEADEQVAHALLQTMNEDPRAISQRLDTLHTRLRENTTSAPTRFRFAPWGIASSIAAAILLTFALFFLSESQRDAHQFNRRDAANWRPNVSRVESHATWTRRLAPHLATTRRGPHRRS